MGQIELFNHLTVYKRRTDVELLVLHSNIWDHLTVREKKDINAIAVIGLQT